MSADIFVDTNVFAYMFDSASPAKQAVAKRLIAASDFVTSAQVLGELYVTLTRKLVNKIPPEIAKRTITELRTMPVVPTTANLVSAAIDTSIRFQLSYWDALIVEAAASSNCTILMTEDLNDQAIIRGVRIVNPFKQVAR